MPYKDVEKERAKQKECYQRRKDVYKQKARENNKKYKERNREYFNAYKLAKGCADCGYNKHAAALDFHHLDSVEKDNSVARLINKSLSIETIVQEVEKCIVLCANCHRIRHVS